MAKRVQAERHSVYANGRGDASLLQRYGKNKYPPSHSPFIFHGRQSGSCPQVWLHIPPWFRQLQEAVTLHPNWLLQYQWPSLEIIRPTFTFLKTAPSSLKTAPGNAKVGRCDFRDYYWRARNHHQRVGSAFYFFTLLLFYLSKSLFCFFPFLFF